jgi:hypothetical protein
MEVKATLLAFQFGPESRSKDNIVVEEGGGANRSTVALAPPSAQRIAISTEQGGIRYKEGPEPGRSQLTAGYSSRI